MGPTVDSQSMNHHSFEAPSSWAPVLVCGLVFAFLYQILPALLLPSNGEVVVVSTIGLLLAAGMLLVSGVVVGIGVERTLGSLRSADSSRVLLIALAVIFGIEVLGSSCIPGAVIGTVFGLIFCFPLYLGLRIQQLLISSGVSYSKPKDTGNHTDWRSQ